MMVPCEGGTSNHNTGLSSDIPKDIQDIDFDELLGTLANWNSHIDYHSINFNGAEKIDSQL
ncbi:MAG: hypothetical protein ACRBBR_13500 [Cellvibrionaceae bacterium]